MRERVIVRLEGTTSAEEAIRVATAAAPGACALTIEALAGPGPALVGSLARVCDVMVDARLAGGPGRVTAAAAALAAYGARWVTVAALAGEDTVAAAVEGTAGRDTAIVPAMAGADVARAMALVAPGSSIGKAVSRMAQAAERAGAGAVLCDPEHLGVVAAVAPDLRSMALASSPGQAVEAFERGAERVVLDLPLHGLGIDGASAKVEEALGRVTAVGGD